MFWKSKKDRDWDLKKLTDEQLESLPLQELQRIRNKRWANGLEELQTRAQDELDRRDPRINWCCFRCGKQKFHEKEIRVSGGFFESYIGWERNKYHAIICSYCGKTEFYNVLMSGAEQSIGFFGS
jgi:predicted nucleic-acid-binding Zn-ribbon protein